MSEQIYILNENGNINGLKDRQYVHNNGILHLAVQCWIMNTKGQVLIQRRSKNKNQSADKWDISFGGHCTKTRYNKDILINNVIKEAKEELGLSITQKNIIKLGEIRYTSHENQNQELLGIFLTQVNSNQKFVFCDGEVCEVQWTTPELLYNNILKHPNEYANRLGALSLLQFYIANLHK